MNYRSVCTGIAAETVAWEPLGWQALSFAEIEPFCCALLHHRYPQVQNYGDFTTIKSYYGDTDLLMGGTPCQSFSVAGRRSGLDDARGNLALDFVRLAQRLRVRWIVWENVKGVLSSDGGRAFGSFLGALVDCGYGFAYRVLDAQYDGLAQRRQRVFVVGYLGDWRPPAAVLFERESLRRDTSPRRAERKESTHSTAGSLRASGPDGSRVGDSRGQDTVVSMALNTKGGSGRLDAESETFATYFNLDSRTKIDNTVARVLKSDTGSGGRGCVMHTLRADGFDAGEDGTWRGTGLVAFDAKQSGNDAGDLSPTLRATPHDKSHANGGGGVAVASGAAVRRLTPREWERLQGFQDDYTAIPYRGKPAKDGPRYRAIGNSISVPTLKWLATRIQMVEDILTR